MVDFDCRQERRVGCGLRPGEGDLRLHAGDAVDGELMLTLELAHLGREVSIEHIAHRVVAARQSLYMLQALAQPAHRLAAHAGGQRLHRRSCLAATA